METKENHIYIKINDQGHTLQTVEVLSKAPKPDDYSKKIAYFVKITHFNGEVNYGILNDQEFLKLIFLETTNKEVTVNEIIGKISIIRNNQHEVVEKLKVLDISPTIDSYFNKTAYFVEITNSQGKINYGITHEGQLNNF